MTIAERINLHRCGYSRAEIDELARQEKEEKQNPEPENKPTPEPEPENKPTPEPEPEDPILKAINNLTQAIQGHNINNHTQPESKETIDDMIRNI